MGQCCDGQSGLWRLWIKPSYRGRNKAVSTCLQIECMRTFSDDVCTACLGERHEGFCEYRTRTRLPHARPSQGTEVKQCFIMLARYSLRYMRVFWEVRGYGICSAVQTQNAAEHAYGFPATHPHTHRRPAWGISNSVRYEVPRGLGGWTA